MAKVFPLTVVVPVPWFPFQRLLRRWKPHFRPSAPHREVQQGIEVRCPRFLSVPGAFKWLDGFFDRAGVPADDAAPQAFVRVQRDRCALRLSGRLRGNVAGPLAGRTGHHYASWNRGAALA